MTSRFFGVRLIVAVAAVVAACKSDPTSGLVGSAASLNFEFKTERVTVGDSVSTFAVLRDQGGNPIDVPIAVTACDPTIAAATASSGAPLIQTNVKIKGIHFGAACVVAKAAGLVDTMQVGALPDKLVVSSGLDTVVSGTTNGYASEYLDKSGAPMTGVPAPVWTSSNGALGLVLDSIAGSIQARDTGVYTLTVSDSIGLLNGTVGQRYSTNKVVATVAAPFNGTTNSPVPPGGTIVLTANVGGPAYDSTTVIWFGANAQATDLSGLPTSVSASVIDLAPWGPLSMGIKGLGPNEITQVDTIAVVTPPQYNGTVSSTTVKPGDPVTIVRGVGDSTWNSSSRAYFFNANDPTPAKARSLWILDVTADSIHAVVPPLNVAATTRAVLLFTHTGTNGTPAQDTIATAPYVSTAPLAGAHAPGDRDPSTADTIALPLTAADTAVVYDINYGGCDQGSATSATDHCDSFFKLVNNTASPDTIHVQMDYFPSFAAVSADQDILFCDDACANFVGNFDGATTADPEQSTVVVPANTTWNLWINLFDPAGEPYVLFRLTVSHP